MDWQPIETAPRDGRRIIAFSQQYGAVLTGRTIHADEAMRDKDYWWMMFGEGRHDDLTHWMPLPSPPTLKD